VRSVQRDPPLPDHRAAPTRCRRSKPVRPRSFNLVGEGSITVHRTTDRSKSSGNPDAGGSPWARTQTGTWQADSTCSGLTARRRLRRRIRSAPPPRVFARPVPPPVGRASSRGAGPQASRAAGASSGAGSAARAESTTRWAAVIAGLREDSDRCLQALTAACYLAGVWRHAFVAHPGHGGRRRAGLGAVGGAVCARG
jgi:hypothetical protein